MHNPKCPRCAELKCGMCGTREKILPFEWYGQTGLICPECRARMVSRLEQKTGKDCGTGHAAFKEFVTKCLADQGIGILFFTSVRFRFVQNSYAMDDAWHLQ